MDGSDVDEESLVLNLGGQDTDRGINQMIH